MSAVEEAFHGLRRMISSGRLGPGQRFPPEADLCAELGVSRSSLREAVRMLSALGAAESRHGSGVYVSALRPEDIIGSLALTVDLLPLSGLLDMYELRRVLESHAAAQAAARSTDDINDRLDALLDALEACDDIEESAQLDSEFHETIATASGNPTMVALLGVFRARSRSYQMFGMPDGRSIKRTSDQAHRSIAHAIRVHDPVAASSAAASHVAQTETWLRFYRPQPTGGSHSTIGDGSGGDVDDGNVDGGSSEASGAVGS
ncbi:FadR/GntR family transcriptional regulator [Planctomonas psychrotolerans]|uniref:FadR/GntR family transcriptional regulator n=1 Tax=Planctomonas psychrotolerans TaxID=2528712 RepID=UPI00123991E9|nr:FadR/GntR family transcriptional regulator [Planctomonas psychrotolerans]